MIDSVWDLIHAQSSLSGILCIETLGDDQLVRLPTSWLRIDKPPSASTGTSRDPASRLPVGSYKFVSNLWPDGIHGSNALRHFRDILVMN